MRELKKDELNKVSGGAIVYPALLIGKWIAKHFN